MEWLDLLQWPAMAVTVTASWLVTSNRPRRRDAGFWLFLLSNVLWIVWGVPEGGYALVVLQLCLAAMNVLGVRKAKRAERAEEGQDAPARDRASHQGAGAARAQ